MRAVFPFARLRFFPLETRVKPAPRAEKPTLAKSVDTGQSGQTNGDPKPRNAAAGPMPRALIPLLALALIAALAILATGIVFLVRVASGPTPLP